MKSTDILFEVERLQPFAEEPLRTAMGRGVQFPTTAARMLSLEQDLERTRAALREALAVLRICAAHSEEGS